ncbi:MAG TPA: FAD:protein FMN transferase [Beijerinckiaceae bacterium]|nr:FAD:protein FMN transferase [Rhodoblastus sp.]MCB1524126.1 FAD:protein FMN transferase [Rhodoblastus sp.]HRY05256.1 FAD:protein FMN transferase [Beijerinckiaceae bacterium]
MASPTRRRLLRLMAASVAMSLAPRAGGKVVEWRGAALGADVSILFSGATDRLAESAAARVLSEIERLEGIFSLQRADSELVRLNTTGRLHAPSPDLVHVLVRAREAHAATHGRFDPTVQALWRFHLDWYAADPAGRRPSESEIAGALAHVGFRSVRIAPDVIELPTGGALTLNGVAQGYITDRATALLRDAGFRHVLVDLGETRAIDARVDGGAWRVALPDGRRIGLADCALATSSGNATRLARNGDHHIFDPTTGRPASHWRWLSVAHRSATVADALSTGLYCLPPPQAIAATRAADDLRLWGETSVGEAIST